MAEAPQVSTRRYSITLSERLSIESQAPREALFINCCKCQKQLARYEYLSATSWRAMAYIRALVDHAGSRSSSDQGPDVPDGCTGPLLDPRNQALRCCTSGTTADACGNNNVVVS